MTNIKPTDEMNSEPRITSWPPPAPPDPAREAYIAYTSEPTRGRRPDDSPAMNYALAEIHDRMLKYERPTDHQIKIGPVNYYPNTGTVHIDGVKGAKKNLTQSQAFDLILKNNK